MKLWVIVKTILILPTDVGVDLVGPFDNYTEAERAVINFPRDKGIDRYLILNQEQLITLFEKIAGTFQY